MTQINPIILNSKMPEFELATKIIDATIVHKMHDDDDVEQEWVITIKVSTVKQPHNGLIYVELNDNLNLIVKINHYVVSNDLSKILITHLMKSSDEISTISANTCPNDYIKIIALSLYNICIKEKNDAHSQSAELKQTNIATQSNIVIPDEIMKKIADYEEQEKNDKTYLNFEGKTELEKRYACIVHDNCDKELMSTETVFNLNNKIIVKANISKYQNYRTNAPFIYYYIRMEGEEGTTLCETYEVIADNKVTETLLDFLRKSDDELNLKYIDSMQYRKSIYKSIDLFWD